MIHHLHNMFSAATDNSGTAKANRSAAGKATLESFKSALSDATATSATASTSAPNGGYDPFLQAAYDYNLAHESGGNTAVPSTSTASTTATPSAAVASTQDAQQTFDNAYWAKQPAAVQALRDVQDPAERTALATELANEGYTIDVPIMAWGWDPSKVTSMRETEGYTWVPSALQSPVEMAPGLPGMDGIAAYDPNNPPAGSIAV